MENWQKYKKWVISGGAIVALALVGVVLYFVIFNLTHTVTLTVTVAPEIAKVRVGDYEFAPVGTYKIEPGAYSVEVSAEGFETRTGNLYAEDGGNVSVTLYLTPTDAGNDWYKTHATDALIMGEVKAQEADTRVQEFAEQNPIVEKLPYTVDYYTEGYARRIYYVITYMMNDTGSGMMIKIKDYSGGNYDAAMVWLKEQGVAPERYVIEYADLSESESLRGK